MLIMYTITQVRDLVFKYKCSNGDTLEEVLDFCESIIFDTSYSKEEQQEYESLYKLLLFGRLRLHSKRMQDGTNNPQSHFDTPHRVANDFFAKLNQANGLIKNNNDRKYAYNKKRYNF